VIRWLHGSDGVWRLTLCSGEYRLAVVHVGDEGWVPVVNGSVSSCPPVQTRERAQELAILVVRERCKEVLRALREVEECVPA
jgi:hypothetical protein